MKRLLAALIPLTFAPVCAFAISLSELQDNSQKYVKIDEDIYSAHYINTESIKSLREASPYYTLQADIYTILYSSRSILQETSVFNYDYTRSFKSINEKLEKEFALKGSKELLYSKAYSNALWDEFQKNSGIVASDSTTEVYSFDGIYRGSLPASSFDYKVDWATACGSYANFVFYKHLGIYFFPEKFS